LLVELSSVVPYGVVCFFTSYRYLEHIKIKWEEMRLDKIRENKLIFTQTQNHYESILALENYKKSCDNGRGAVFFAIVRSKVSEGVDFEGHYGRCVVIFSIPY
jgi:DNA excision repair protein ERCC-2